MVIQSARLSASVCVHFSSQLSAQANRAPQTSRTPAVNSATPRIAAPLIHPKHMIFGKLDPHICFGHASVRCTCLLITQGGQCLCIGGYQRPRTVLIRTEWRMTIPLQRNRRWKYDRAGAWDGGADRTRVVLSIQPAHRRERGHGLFVDAVAWLQTANGAGGIPLVHSAEILLRRPQAPQPRGSLHTVRHGAYRFRQTLSRHGIHLHSRFARI